MTNESTTNCTANTTATGANSTPSLTLHFDGASEPRNPSHTVGYGYVLRMDGQLIGTGSGYRSDQTELISNNVAEYMGLHAGLLYLKMMGWQEMSIAVFGDSQLVIKQMSGQWQIKRGMYRQMALKTKALGDEFKHIRFSWIPREQNKEADRLSTILLKREKLLCTTKN